MIDRKLEWHVSHVGHVGHSSHVSCVGCLDDVLNWDTRQHAAVMQVRTNIIEERDGASNALLGETMTQQCLSVTPFSPCSLCSATKTKSNSQTDPKQTLISTI